MRVANCALFPGGIPSWREWVCAPGMCYDEICAKVGGPSEQKLLLVQ